MNPLAELPWLVVFGAVVGKTSLPIFVLLGCVVDVRRARGSDGAAVAASARACVEPSCASFDALLPITASLVVRGRAEMIDYVRWHPEVRSYGLSGPWRGPMLEEFALDARWRARSIRALGDDAAAVEYDRASDRLSGAARRGDLAAIMAVLQLTEGD